jgi:nucleoside diphosphate kinase
MAFPTVSAPYGFKPINRFDGMPYAGATNQYPVTSGQAVFNGQVVAFVTGGTVSPVALTGSTSIYAVGVVMGVQYTNSTGQTVQAQYAPASGVTNVIAYVVNDPAAEFKVAVTNASSVIVPVAGTILNSSVGGVTGTGDTATGNINSSVNGSTAATGTTLLFRVTALVPETIDVATGNYTEVIVKFNGTWHQQLSTIGTAPA